MAMAFNGERREEADAEAVTEADWDARADRLEAGQPRLGRFPIPGLVRSARRIADLSQREMAKRAGVAPSTVGRVESGTLVPSLALLERLLACAELELIVVDPSGRVVQPMREAEWTRDGAERRYPSHLDTILNPRGDQWWGDKYGLVCPPETFIRDRARRDSQRARSQWEVRVKQYRNQPRPELYIERERRRAWMEERRRRAREAPFPWTPEDYDDLDAS
jgi:transcriptional regulator with XRE-family HTH domain